MLLPTLLCLAAVIACAVYVELGRQNAKLSRLPPPPRAPTSPPAGARKLHVLKRTKLSRLQPFENRTRILSRGQRVFMSIMAVTVVPVRIVLFLVASLGIAGASFVAVAGTARQDDRRPLSPFRKLIHRATLPFMRLLFFSLGYWRLHVVGRCAPPSVAPIIVSNHSSLVDVVLIYLHCASGVSKVENARIPLVGHAARALRCVFVDRSSVESRAATLSELRRRATEPGWDHLLIFPEATTTNRTTVAVFRRGAFTPGVPVQPVLLQYPHSDVDPTLVRAGPQLLGLIFRLMTQPYNSVTITYLPVYAPSDAEKRDPNLYAENVRQLMAKSLGVPTASHSYFDTHLMTVARKLKLPPESAAVEINAVLKALPVTVEQCTEWLPHFARVSQRTGRISLQQFLACYGTRAASLRAELTRVFDMLDEDSSGDLDLREYLVAMAVARCPLEGVLRQCAVELVFGALAPAKLDSVPIASLQEAARVLLPTMSATEVEELCKVLDPEESGRVTLQALNSTAGTLAFQQLARAFVFPEL